MTGPAWQRPVFGYVVSDDRGLPAIVTARCYGQAWLIR
jgi:hypothetical protein